MSDLVDKVVTLKHEDWLIAVFAYIVWSREDCGQELIPTEHQMKIWI